MRAWPRPVGRIDVALAILVFVVGTLEAAGKEDLRGSLAVNVLLLGIMSAALVWRRRRPLIAVLTIVAGAVAQAAVATDASQFATTFAILLLTAFSVAAYAPDREALAGLAACVGLVVVVDAFAQEPMTLGDYLFPCGLAFCSWLAGRGVRHRSRLAEAMHELAVRAEEDRETHRRAVVADERRRLAREMHDIVAHSISVMVVQAGGARRILDRDPERAAEAAAQIEQTGREALMEMRRLLGVLRPADQRAERAPQPGLGGLDALVERARDAGLAVEVRVEGERRELPGGIDLAAYRVVQEALTNCLRHAGGAGAEVHVRYGPDELEIEVADRGPGPAGAGTPVGGAGGHGLIGMRERVRVHGGELEAGPRPGGGFAVRARLPVGAGEALPA